MVRAPVDDIALSICHLLSPLSDKL